MTKVLKKEKINYLKGSKPYLDNTISYDNISNNNISNNNINTTLTNISNQLKNIAIIDKNKEFKLKMEKVDKNSNLEIKSNRFDIADGRSSLKSECDLVNLKYNVKLGVKDINSDLMAKTLFNLEKEITGKASGIMELRTDKTMKLNGSMKFVIKEF